MDEQQTSMTDWIKLIVEARMLVGSLGENASPAWWRSEATTPAGIRFLERLYPRTSLVASIETVSHAARLVHDVPLARVGQYHLFRLPIADELAIRAWLRQSQGMDDLHRFAGRPAAERVEALVALAASEAVTDARGPVNCGSVDALQRNRKRTIQRICAVYLVGFENGQPVYPYLGGASA